MKDKPKKKKKPKDKPSLPIPRDWKELVLDDQDVDVLKIEEDNMALQVGNKPSMEELVKHAKKGDKKSFLVLIKIHTSVHLSNNEENSKLKIPFVSADRDFYEQEWVQKILDKGMKDKEFRKYFWKAVSSRQNNTLFKSTASELKRYISIWKNKWARQAMTVTEIKKELQRKKLLSMDLRAKGTLEKFLERCGVKRPKARGRPKKKNTT